MVLTLGLIINLNVMKLNSNLKNALNTTIFGLVFILSTACNSTTQSEEKSIKSSSTDNADQYFSVKIAGKLWQAFPSKEFKTYNLSYKELGHQFSIFAEAEDGSRMDLSFHAHDQLVTGSYPSTRNDNGMLSGVFYYPEAKSSDKEMASTTFDYPVQENTVQVTKIDKSDRTAYIIEGTF